MIKAIFLIENNDFPNARIMPILQFLKFWNNIQVISLKNFIFNLKLCSNVNFELIKK